jgi:hypothetical protein
VTVDHHDPTSLAAQLNRSCHCITLDEALLDQALHDEGARAGIEQLLTTHPQLFSRSAVFIEEATHAAMRSVVEAVERVVALPRYVAQVLESAHPHARVATSTRGAFLGFDFHLSETGPQLIEINTNAGGGMLNAFLRRAQRACCEPVADAFGVGREAPQRFLSMLREEFRLGRGDAPLERVAIVDDAPQGQFLYPEFVLFARLLEAQGVRTVIADPRELRIEGDALVHDSQRIDLVYNRLTDFTLEQADHAALAEALVRGLSVITPHPRAHALYADKRRLALLSDAEALSEFGASADDVKTLHQHVPHTRVVTPDARELLWKERKALFFKPEAGYGAKATYRGDKITKGAFEDVMRGGYVAQRMVPPSSRVLSVEGETRELKADIRMFAYASEVQLVCARLYQGQTTNFRTLGGGFAPVYVTRS